MDFTKSAHRQFKRLHLDIAVRIFNAIVALANDPNKAKAKKLTNVEGYRLRISDFRIIYVVDHSDRLIRITSIVHRKDAY